MLRRKPADGYRLFFRWAEPVLAQAAPGIPRISISISAGSGTMDNIRPGASVYIDTNIFVYYVEADPQFVHTARTCFLALEAGNATILTSELTIAECLYYPSKMDNLAAIAAYERLFASGEIGILPIYGALARRAAAHGGKLGLKLLDAMHYFTALEAGCEVFVTNDRCFRSGPAMRVINPFAI